MLRACATLTQALTAAVGSDPAIIAGYQVESLVPFNPVDKRTSATVVSPQGEKLVVAKGAPQVCRFGAMPAPTRCSYVHLSCGGVGDPPSYICWSHRRSGL